MAQFDRITFDPAIMGGKPCIRGQRVTVGTVLGLLAAGRTRDEILKAYSYLETEDIDQCLANTAFHRSREVERSEVENLSSRRGAPCRLSCEIFSVAFTLSTADLVPSRAAELVIGLASKTTHLAPAR